MKNKPRQYQYSQIRIPKLAIEHILMMNGIDIPKGWEDLPEDFLFSTDVKNSTRIVFQESDWDKYAKPHQIGIGMNMPMTHTRDWEALETTYWFKLEAYYRKTKKLADTFEDDEK